MIPGSLDFTLDAANLIFLGAFYLVLATVATGLAIAVQRTRRDLRPERVAAIRWQHDFEELPAEARPCRHALTGESPGRTCRRGFACDTCLRHAELTAVPPLVQELTEQTVAGLVLPARHFFHRGHTWARPEEDGTVTVGVDALGERLLGTPDRVELPATGAHLAANGTVATAVRGGARVRLVSPVSGTVVAAERSGAGFLVRVRPDRAPVDLRHLLNGREAAAWLQRELDRFQLLVSPQGVPALADGGELVADLGEAIPERDRDRVLGEMFLEP